MAFGGKTRELEAAHRRIQELEQLVPADYQTYWTTINELQQQVAVLQSTVAAYQQAGQEWQAHIAAKQAECASLDQWIAAKNAEMASLDDQAMYLDAGLAQTSFQFENVEQYKMRLKQIRNQQKTVVRSLNEQASLSSWTVNNDNQAGRRMVRDITKLILRAFNGECDEIVRKVKFANLGASLAAIDKSAGIVCRLAAELEISIPQEYVELKKQEVAISFEYARFGEEEKERQRVFREQEREAKKLEKEIAEQRRRLDKEMAQFGMELQSVMAQLQNAPYEMVPDLMQKKAYLESNLAEVQKAQQDVDYREANQRAGYVYVISNVGSFGENVYKIGMTRRLDPMDRVKELGDASVPFGFDVHAMIFTDDAPGLEAALHRDFESRKLNLVNPRREFFRCTLQEIKEAVYRSYDRTVEFVDFPDAEQFRMSEAIRMR